MSNKENLNTVLSDVRKEVSEITYDFTTPESLTVYKKYLNESLNKHGFEAVNLRFENGIIKYELHHIRTTIQINVTK